MHGGIVSSTKIGKEGVMRMSAGMAGMIAKTQPEGMGAVLSGVLMHTAPKMRMMDSVMKSDEPAPKTMARTLGQVPYAGKKY
jgi:hypothetical protein